MILKVVTIIHKNTDIKEYWMRSFEFCYLSLCYSVVFVRYKICLENLSIFLINYRILTWIFNQPFFVCLFVLACSQSCNICTTESRKNDYSPNHREMWFCFKKQNYQRFGYYGSFSSYEFSCCGETSSCHSGEFTADDLGHWNLFLSLWVHKYT